MSPIEAHLSPEIMEAILRQQADRMPAPGNPGRTPATLFGLPVVVNPNLPPHGAVVVGSYVERHPVRIRFVDDEEPPPFRYLMTPNARNLTVGLSRIHDWPKHWTWTEGARGNWRDRVELALLRLAARILGAETANHWHLERGARRRELSMRHGRREWIGFDRARPGSEWTTAVLSW